MISRMQHVHYLYRQNNHYTTARLSLWCSHAQLQLSATIDHILQHVVNGVLVDLGALSDELPHFMTYAADKHCCAGTFAVPGIIGKDPPQIPIVNRGPLKVVPHTFPTV